MLVNLKGIKFRLPPTYPPVRPFPETSSRTCYYYCLSCYHQLMTLGASQKQVGSFCYIILKFPPLKMERIWSILNLLILSVTLSRRGRMVECKVEEVCLEFPLSFQLRFLIGYGWSEITISKCYFQSLKQGMGKNNNVPCVFQ